MAMTSVTASLRRTLSLSDLIFIVVGTVIGSGIFLTPGAVVRSTGSGGVALLAWIIGGVLSLLGALTFAELGAATPDSGGPTPTSGTRSARCRPFSTAGRCS